MNQTKGIRFFFILFIGLIMVISFGIVFLNNYKGKIRMESYKFTESSKELRNPGRGFYNIYRFMIADEKENYWQLVQEMYKSDVSTSLSLIEINLQRYSDDEISEEGMDNIVSLFHALEDIDKQLIVRFVYDWDGECEKYEPETIDTILRHMKQMEKVLKEFGTHIFIIQGLFIGNWGEMNGTKYFNDEDLLRLMEQLSDVSDRSTYLAVRTPEQWREITGLQEISEESLKGHLFAGRISLYNDGMLGNESDYGTYRVYDMAGKRISERENELSFQGELCKWVPNGGEVINDNPYNDFNQAVRDLSSMHVSYLNEGHDQEVLNKWKNTKIIKDGCYKGSDGYTYIERHLGYRLLIKNVNMHFNSFVNNLEVSVTMKNVGFAPLYNKAEAGLVLYDKGKETFLLYEMEGDLRKLTGGNESEEQLTLTVDIPVNKLLDTKYTVYFFVTDVSTGQRIDLANEQDAEEYGYCIGNVEL